MKQIICRAALDEDAGNIKPEHSYVAQRIRIGIPSILKVLSGENLLYDLVLLIPFWRYPLLDDLISQVNYPAY